MPTTSRNDTGKNKLSRIKSADFPHVSYRNLAQFTELRQCAESVAKYKILTDVKAGEPAISTADRHSNVYKRLEIIKNYS